MSLDWGRLEEVVERAVRRARSEELREVADAVKTLAEYMKTGFQETNKRIEELGKTVAELAKRVEEHGRRLDELTKAVAELKVAMGSLGRRWGRDLERTVLEIYRDALEKRGVEPGRVEKFVYTDVDGRFMRPGTRIEVDVYIHDGRTYLLEVKSHAELEDVEWFAQKAEAVEKILGRKADRLIIVAVNIDKEALERAAQLGIDAVYGAVIE
ncbi:PD-(D/E)XK nuclease family protein [Pyrobaculum sp.]|uniref:PD-(D/E)XK nuclease family protein n=1 Tax=Pyrobaculum sp. TaxID=2004705 RepID=UPI003D12EE05